VDAISSAKIWEESVIAGHHARRNRDYVIAHSCFARALEAAISFGEADGRILESLETLGSLCRDLNSLEEAENYFAGAIEFCQRCKGQDHSSLVLNLNRLARVYRDDGKIREAESLYLRALAIRRRKLGDNHPSVASLVHNLGIFYSEQGESSQSLGSGRELAQGAQSLIRPSAT